jgi:hypothetical protein
MYKVNASGIERVSEEEGEYGINAAPICQECLR